MAGRYPTPDGGSAVFNSEQEARAAGWTPSMGTLGAYTQDANFQPASGGGGGGGGAPTAAPQSFGGIDATAFGNAIRDATAPLYSQVSGFERDKLKQENDQFLANLQLERDKLERLGVPELQIRQRLADLEIEHTRRMDTLAEEIQRGQLSLGRGQLGLDYLSRAANFAESDPFALSNFMRGAQGTPDVPMFIQNLRQNVGPQQQMGAPGGQAPAPITFDTLQQGLQGGGAPGVPLAFQPQYIDRTLGAVRDVVNRGAGSLAAGSLESLDTNEANTLASGIKHVAGTAAVPAFLQAYGRNPIRKQTASKPGVMNY